MGTLTENTHIFFIKRQDNQASYKYVNVQKTKKMNFLENLVNYKKLRGKRLTVCKPRFLRSFMVVPILPLPSQDALFTWYSCHWLMDKCLTLILFLGDVGSYLVSVHIDIELLDSYLWNIHVFDVYWMEIWWFLWEVYFLDLFIDMVSQMVTFNVYMGRFIF